MEQNKPKKRRGRPPKSEQKVKPPTIPKEIVIDFGDDNTDIEHATIIEDDDEFMSNLNNENYGKEQEQTPQEYFYSNDGEQLMTDEQEQPLQIQYEDEDYYDINKPVSYETEMLFQNIVENSKKRGRKPKGAVAFQSLQEDSSTDLFSSKGSQILGRTKRELVAKLTQYRQLFPEELKSFKVKKDANEEELQAYLDEMEVIVSVSSVDNFITDSILNCIRIVEGVSANTQKYNISGCADLLKQNKDFHSLCKQLYIKYKVFSSIPCEYQLLMIVATTAFIARSKNIHIEKMSAFLNEQVPLGTTTNNK